MPKVKLGRDPYKDCEERANTIIGGTMRYKRITQEDVAKALKISHGSVGNKLNGNTKWNMEELFRVIDYLKISNEDILKMFGRKA